MRSSPSLSGLPRPLRFALLVLAWASLPMWPLTIAGIWLLDDKSLDVCRTTATIGTFCGLILLGERIILLIIKRTDERIREATEHTEQKQALILGIDRLSGAPTQPQPRPALRRARSR